MAIAFVGDSEWLDLDTAHRTDACRRMNKAYEAFKVMVQQWDPEAADPEPQSVEQPILETIFDAHAAPKDVTTASKELEHA
jgi:hypothetical protein